MQPFVPDPDREFSRNVQFKVPTAGGAFQQVTLKCDFKSMPKSQAQACAEDNTFDDGQLLRLVLKRVHGVGDGNGDALDPADAVEPMLEESGFCLAAATEYYEGVLGGNFKSKTSARQR